MAQEYKIARVSEQQPRAWEGPKGTIYYIKVQLEGHNRPVSIGKKSPDALKVGDTVFGTITEDLAHDEDKFKAEQQGGGYGGGKGGGFKADPLTMYISYAKDVYVAMLEKSTKGEVDEEKLMEALKVIKQGGEFLNNSTSDSQPTATHSDPPAGKKMEKPDEVITDIGDEPINLDDIPF